MKMLVIAITGGAGFVGRRLAASLLEDHGLSIQEVRLLDIKQPEPIPFAPTDERYQRFDIDGVKLKYVPCDLTHKHGVETALQGVDTVFHLASYGMSGREMLNVHQIRRVNLDGTLNVISACEKLRIPRLLYCSTYNVVFGTNTIINGSEDKVPYYPLDQFHDEYSKTKRMAEEWILEANSSTLSTCSIRPAAIYGDGEERHLPRIFSHVRLGLGVAAIGSRETLCDWLYVDNLSHALILAATSLTLHGTNSPAAGSVYCISDQHPINNFEFLKLLCQGLGYKNVFRFYLPATFMFYLAWLLELIRLILIESTCGRISFQPILTRSEVMKVGVTHYFSMAKAQHDLGYEPIVPMATGIERCIEYYREEFGTDQVKLDATKKAKTTTRDR